MLHWSRVTRRGRTTVPRRLREKYGLGAGGTVTYVDLGGQIILIFGPRDPVESLKRMRVETGKTVAEVKEEALEAAIRDARRDRRGGGCLGCK